MGRPRLPRPARGGEGTPAPGGEEDSPAPAAPGGGEVALGTHPHRDKLSPDPAGTPARRPSPRHRERGTPAPGAGREPAGGSPAPAPSAEGGTRGLSPAPGTPQRRRDSRPPPFAPGRAGPVPGTAATPARRAEMERPVPLPRGIRPRARHCYEGFVDKRGPRDEGYRRLWAGLRGLTLAFYKEPRDYEPLEVLDLGELVAVQAEGEGLVLRLRGQEVTMKMESWEAQEMWRGFILTMAKMKIPPDLELLPGHVFLLLEALREERKRRDSPVSPATPVSPAIPVSPATPVSPVSPASPDTPVSPTPSEPVPSCFFEVTRAEAERLLEQSAGRGSLVLRPGGHGQGVSVTTRQELNGTALLRHYRVKREAQGYVIDVEPPHCCSSLAEVVQFFVEESKGSLQPLYPEYSSQLEFLQVQGDTPTAVLMRRPALRRDRGPPRLVAVPEEQIYMNDPGKPQKVPRKPKLCQAHPKD